MPESIKTIKSNAFYFAKFEEIVLNTSNLETIDSYGFAYNSNLKSISLPVTLKRINSHSFAGCLNVNAIYFNCDAPVLSDVSEINGVRTITSAFGTIDNNTLTGKNSREKIAYVPANSTGYDTVD